MQYIIYKIENASLTITSLTSTPGQGANANTREIVSFNADAEIVGSIFDKKCILCGRSTKVVCLLYIWRISCPISSLNANNL